MQTITSRLRSWLKYLVWRTTKIRPSPHSSKDWDREYASGLWNQLEHINELAHYSVIAGYARLLKPVTLLDVACGRGVLADHLREIRYQHYLGVDLSHEAVSVARQQNVDSRMCFAVCDARQFSFDRKFDLIIFNECLYYFGSPRAIIDTYRKLLAPGGKMIVSMWTAPETLAVWPEVQAVMTVEDAVTIKHHESGLGWTVKLLSRPEPASQKL